MQKCECGCDLEVTKEGNRFIKGHWVKLNNPMKNPEILALRSGMNHFFFGKTRPDFTGENHPNFGKEGPWAGKERPEMSGSNHPGWNGGTYWYWHGRAWELFGQDQCELCEKSNAQEILETGDRLSVHNTLNPKDYTIMKKEVWITTCKSCHLTRLDAGGENVKGKN